MCVLSSLVVYNPFWNPAVKLYEDDLLGYRDIVEADFNCDTLSGKQLSRNSDH